MRWALHPKFIDIPISLPLEGYTREGMIEGRFSFSWASCEQQDNFLLNNRHQIFVGAVGTSSSARCAPVDGVQPLRRSLRSRYCPQIVPFAHAVDGC